jgi:hypothetical protein
MTIGDPKYMRNFIPARKRVEVSPGESVRIIRELQGLTQRSSRSYAAFRKLAIPALKPGASILVLSVPKP